MCSAPSSGSSSWCKKYLLNRLQEKHQLSPWHRAGRCSSCDLSPSPPRIGVPLWTETVTNSLSSLCNLFNAYTWGKKSKQTNCTEASPWALKTQDRHFPPPSLGECRGSSSISCGSSGTIKAPQASRRSRRSRHRCWLGEVCSRGREERLPARLCPPVGVPPLAQSSCEPE